MRKVISTPLSAHSGKGTLLPLPRVPYFDLVNIEWALSNESTLLMDCSTTTIRTNTVLRVNGFKIIGPRTT